jgi:hypothetical protein
MTNARPFVKSCSQPYRWTWCSHAPGQGPFGEAVVALFLNAQGSVALIGGDEVRFSRQT